MDIYIEAVQNTCPAELAQDIARLDFATDESFRRSSQTIRKAEEIDDCAVALARFFAAKYAENPRRADEAHLLSVILRLPPPRRAEAAPEARRALQIMPLSDAIAHQYFNALLVYDLDLRDRYDTQFPVGSVADPHSSAFRYYMYLADLQDSRGLTELSRVATAAEGDPHQLNGVLMPLADLQRSDASAIFRRYLNDERRGTGVNGPGTGPSVASIARRGLLAMELQAQNR